MYVLKSIPFAALAHYHMAISINVNQKCNPVEMIQEQFNNNFDLNEISSATSTSDAAALKRAHIRESIACHEEAQRLQRMCRELKSKVSLTKILQETHLKAVIEAECIEEELLEDKIIEEDSFEEIETTLNRE